MHMHMHVHMHVQKQKCARVCTETRKAQGRCLVSAAGLKSKIQHPSPVAHAQNGPPSELEKSAMALPKTKLMIAVNFMTMFSAGPEVSFSGSPTVSPVTEFLCASEPFTYSLPRPPAEMYFFELSQAPPVLLMEMASCTLETRAPDRSPAQAFLPKPRPATSGLRITRAPGASISRSDASVEMRMHRS